MLVHIVRKVFIPPSGSLNGSKQKFSKFFGDGCLIALNVIYGWHECVICYSSAKGP